MPVTRQEFKQYCLRALGAPVIEINVADEQIEDRIDDALQKYYEFHFSGTYHALVKHKVTQADIDTKSIPITSDIQQVVRLIPQGSLGMSAHNLEYVAYISDLIRNITSPMGGLDSYVRGQSYLNLMNDIVNAQGTIEHVRVGNTLRLTTLDSKIKEGSYIVIECYVRATPIDYPETWNDSWLQRYATELIRRQWGQNLMKYEGAQLPSGITINASGILSEANENLQELEQELRDVWEVPVLGRMA